MFENDLAAEAVTDPRTYADEQAMHGLFARLRRTDPVARVEADGFIPFWLLTRHADITAVELDPERFINAPRQAILPIAYEERARQATGGRTVQQVMRNLVAMDGRDHRVYRAITQSRFLAKALGSIRTDIEALATEFVGRMEGRDGACDFSADIAMWFPLRVIMTILGVPPEDEALMLRLAQQVLSSQDPEFNGDGGGGGAAAAIMEMFAYFKPIIADRQRDPRGDIASVIANAEVDGAPLPERDIFGYFLIIASAGHDTTSYSLAGGLLALLRHPEQMRMLRADPTLLGSAADEAIRWSSPVRHFCRTATQDCEIGGRRIKAGDVLMLSYPSANRDETVFEDPFSFRVDRKPNRHLAFGTGPHLCLGQHLARLELMAFFREMLSRVDEIELAGPPRFVQSSFVGGAKTLPIRYRMARRVRPMAMAG